MFNILFTGFDRREKKVNLWTMVKIFMSMIFNYCV